MKIDYISDIHLDFWIKEYTASNKLTRLISIVCENINLVGGDVLIIAGDLGHYYTQDTEFLKFIRPLYKNVLLVRGNHDLYLVSQNLKSKYKFNSFNRTIEMKEFCEKNGISYMDGNVTKIDGVTFGGVGMSWDKSYYDLLLSKVSGNEEVQELFNRTMNDSRLILKGRDIIKIPLAYSGYTISSLFDPFEFFEEEYKKLQLIKNVDVMISHYAPIVIPNMPEDYADSLSTTFYMFDGIKDIKRINPLYWIFGHTHVQYNFNIENTNFLCNPLGYPQEKTKIKVKTLIID